MVLRVLKKNTRKLSWRVNKPPLTLFNKQMEVFSGNAFETSRMTLRLVPDALKADDMVSGINELLGVIDPAMPELSDIQSIMAQKAITIENNVRFDRPLNDRISVFVGRHDRHQRFLLGIRDVKDVYLAASPEQPEYQNFVTQRRFHTSLSGRCRSSYRRPQPLLRVTSLFRRALMRSTG